MSKYPRLGEVKTRLAAGIGQRNALEVYKSLLENAIKQCRPRSDQTYEFGCAVAPSETLIAFESLYSGLDFYLPQEGNDLGERMLHTLTLMLEERSADKAILIGADIPRLDRHLIETAFDALAQTDIILGPTADGGYYLIGMKKPIRVLFEGLNWGESDILERTIKIISNNGLSHSLLTELTDLDTVDDMDQFPEFKVVTDQS